MSWNSEIVGDSSQTGPAHAGAWPCIQDFLQDLGRIPLTKTTNFIL